jgi:hypothetical protein
MKSLVVLVSKMPGAQRCTKVHKGAQRCTKVHKGALPGTHCRCTAWSTKLQRSTYLDFLQMLCMLGLPRDGSIDQRPRFLQRLWKAKEHGSKSFQSTVVFKKHAHTSPPTPKKPHLLFVGSFTKHNFKKSRISSL